MARRRHVLVVGALALAVAAGGLSWARGAGAADAAAPETEKPRQAPAGIRWHRNLDEALKAARDEGKPVFIDFHADWCGFCKMLDSQTFTDPRVREALTAFAAVKVDTEKEKETAAKYGVQPIPALFVTDEEGRTLAKALGFKPPAAFLDFLAYASARHKLAKDAGDAAAACTAAEKSDAADVPPEERVKLANAALGLIDKEDKARRGKLLLVRAAAVARDEAAEPDAAKKDVEEARSLDPGNEHGTRELGDWLLVQIGYRRSGDVEALGKSVEKFLADYPAGKIKDQSLRNEAMRVRFGLKMQQKDQAGAIAVLEQLKAENRDPELIRRVDEILRQLKERSGGAGD